MLHPFIHHVSPPIRECNAQHLIFIALLCVHVGPGGPRQFSWQPVVCINDLIFDFLRCRFRHPRRAHQDRIGIPPVRSVVCHRPPMRAPAMLLFGRSHPLTPSAAGDLPASPRRCRACSCRCCAATLLVCPMACRRAQAHGRVRSLAASRPPPAAVARDPFPRRSTE